MPVLKYTRWSDIELEHLNPLLDRQFVVGENIMLARVLLKKGCIVPEHSHVNEQITYVVSGAIKLKFDSGDVVLQPGELIVIPAHEAHAAEAIEDCQVLDSFAPRREDWINKDDAYLRK